SFAGTLGALGDAGGFTVAGGTQTLNAVTGNYTGATTIDNTAGTFSSLTLLGSTDISKSSGMAFVNGGTFDISSNGATTIQALTSSGSDAQVNLGGNTLTVTAATGSFSGTLGASGDSGGFTVAGGTQTLSGVTSNYTGTTTVSGGTLA